MSEGDRNRLNQLRDHVAKVDGDELHLVLLRTLEEKMVGKTGQYALFVEHIEHERSRQTGRRGPLTGDCIVLGQPEESTRTRFSLGVLKAETLNLNPWSNLGLETGKIAGGFAPDGRIEVFEGPLKFNKDQYWILFGSSNGVRESDNGRTRTLLRNEVVVGDAEIPAWLNQNAYRLNMYYSMWVWQTFLYQLMLATERDPADIPALKEFREKYGCDI